MRIVSPLDYQLIRVHYVNKLLKSIDYFKIFILLKSTISIINAEEGNLHIINSDSWAEYLCAGDIA